jgi:hypothetical protein
MAFLKRVRLPPSACERIGQRLSLPVLIGFFFLGLSLFGPAVADNDPFERLKTFSELAPIDLRKLQEGDIRGEPGSPMSFPNGFWAETCFAVPVAAEEVARRLQIWNPSLHPTLKAIEFHKVSVPCNAADFERLIFTPGNRPLRWLLDKSLATTARKSELNLSSAEAQQLGDCLKGKPPPQVVAACWSKLLLERATAFQRDGFAGMAPYTLSGENVSPAICLREMMRERPGVAKEFAPLLSQSGVLRDVPPVTLKAFHYWGMYEANHHGTLTLGVVYLLPAGDRYQLLDAQYYVSSTYYTSVTLYEVWPSQVGEKPGALVWRGDFFAAPSLAYAKGFERLAYGTVMLQELKKTIRFFQDDLRRPLGEEVTKPLQ